MDAERIAQIRANLAACGDVPYYRDDEDAAWGRILGDVSWLLDALVAAQAELETLEGEFTGLQVRWTAEREENIQRERQAARVPALLAENTRLAAQVDADAMRSVDFQELGRERDRLARQVTELRSQLMRITDELSTAAGWLQRRGAFNPATDARNATDDARDYLSRLGSLMEHPTPEESR